MLILSWQKGLRVWSLEVENKKKKPDILGVCFTYVTEH